MIMLLISKSEKDRLNFVSGVNINFVFVCRASSNVYYNFKTAHILFYSVYYTSYDILFHLKTDCAC